MANQEINVGSAPDSGDGDPLRTAFTKCNENYYELYGTLGTLGTVYAGTGHLHAEYADAVHSHTEYAGTGHDHNALYSGTAHGHAYSSLTGLPTLGSVAALDLNGTAGQFLNGTGGWGTPSAGSVAWDDVTSKPATFPAVLGTGGTDACSGTDARLSDARTPLSHNHDSLYSGTGHNHDTAYSGTGHDHAALYSGTGHTHSIYLQTSTPSATGYAVMTAASQAAGRTAIAAGTSNFDGAYASLSGNPTLGSVSTLNTNGTAAYFLNGTGGWAIPPGTATGGGGGGATVRYGRVTSISTGTGTAYADVPGLSVGISPSETVQFHAYLMGGCNGTGGARFTISAPTGATGSFYVAGNGASATAYTMAVCTAVGVDPGVNFWNANSTVRMVELHGMVVNGTNSGSIQVRRRNPLAGTFVVTVSVNSHINGMVTS